MIVWSTFARCASQNLQKTRIFQPNFSFYNATTSSTSTRNMSGHMVLTATRWQWHKTKDYFHLYVLVGAIPLSILTFLVNIYVGPATLTEIPEGYVPQHYEYYRHPITRFMVRYIYGTPQKDYEKCMHAIFDESQMMKIRALEKKIWRLQAERQDYRYNHFLPVTYFATREFREIVRRDKTGIDSSY